MELIGIDPRYTEIRVSQIRDSFWCPSNRDYRILRSNSGSPYSRKLPHIRTVLEGHPRFPKDGGV